MFINLACGTAEQYLPRGQMSRVPRRMRIGRVQSASRWLGIANRFSRTVIQASWVWYDHDRVTFNPGTGIIIAHPAGELHMYINL
jgi:hypothetical protein